MIRIRRVAEPASLAARRATHLPRVRALGYPPTQKDLGDYDVAREDLWQMQACKCCYCERVTEAAYNDVEHYRPKVTYWWLTWTWENQLFACPPCNRTHKGAQFPLQPGSLPLVAEEAPPGGEQPLLIDPSANDNPMAHIRFVHRPLIVGQSPRWLAEPRNQSRRGHETIAVCRLNRDQLVELRGRHVDTWVRPALVQHKSAILRGDDAVGPLRHLLLAHAAFAALSYDALDQLAPALAGLPGWPTIDEMPLVG